MEECFLSTIAKQNQNEGIRALPILISFLIAGFIGLFSETALNMALGGLMKEFGVLSSTVQWLTTGYLLTLGILIPISALLIQTFSTRQLFVTSLLFSILGTIVAALAPVFGILLLGRVIQAIGTGILIPLMFNTILLIFPIHKRGTIMGLMGLVMMVAPAIGPALSGLIIEKLSWNWIFGLPYRFLRSLYSWELSMCKMFLHSQSLNLIVCRLAYRRLVLVVLCMDLVLRVKKDGEVRLSLQQS